MRKTDSKFSVVDSHRKLIVRGRMTNDGNNDHTNNGSVSEKDRRKTDNDKLSDSGHNTDCDTDRTVALTEQWQ